ncbi:MAG: glutamine amidotransferase [Rhodobacteraceae bacterium]|nr:glutamine amidotransferase [Paracoccaceae bacterium]
MTKKILLNGESWTASETHLRGVDAFGRVHFHLGAEPFVEAVSDAEFRVEYMPRQVVVDSLPFTDKGLAVFDAIFIADIDANSLLRCPDVRLRGKPVPNRLKPMRDYYVNGCGLMMVGDHLTFQGIKVPEGFSA